MNVLGCRGVGNGKSTSGTFNVIHAYFNHRPKSTHEFSRGEFVFVSWLSDLCRQQRPLLTVGRGYDAARRLGFRSAAMLCVRAYVVFKAWVKLSLSSSRTSDSWWVPGSRGGTMPPAVVPVFLACASTRVAESPA